MRMNVKTKVKLMAVVCGGVIALGGGLVHAGSAPSEAELKGFYQTFHDTLHNDLPAHRALLEKHLSDTGTYDIKAVTHVDGMEPVVEHNVYTKTEMLQGLNTGHSPENTYTQDIKSIEYSGDTAVVTDTVESTIFMSLPNPQSGSVIKFTYNQVMNCVSDIARGAAGSLKIENIKCEGDVTMEGGPEAQPFIKMIAEQKRAIQNSKK